MSVELPLKNKEAFKRLKASKELLERMRIKK
jgi:hypothetical protein